MSDRPEYSLELEINDRKLTRVLIDQHYRVGHPEVNDELILKLVMTLDKGSYLIQEEKDGFEYFVVDPVIYEERPYRLVLLLCLFDDYLGVVNAFRVRRKK